MSLPTNFSGMPSEELHRDFKNTCIALEKAIKDSMDLDFLLMEMEKFIHMSQKMTWVHLPSSVYHKEEGQKAVGKIYREFKRYVKDLQSNQPQESKQDLLDAITIVHKMIDSMQVY